MKIWILVDEQDIVRCMASDVRNLHASKIEAGMIPELVERGGTVGDEYKDGVWTPRPENYPPPKEMPPSELALLEARVKKLEELNNASSS